MHAAAIENLTVYLPGTCNNKLILEPNRAKYFEAYDDAHFCGNWYRPTARDDTLTAKSQSGYVLIYSEGPIVWASKLQTDIALSSTEENYVYLSVIDIFNSTNGIT